MYDKNSIIGVDFMRSWYSPCVMVAVFSLLGCTHSRRDSVDERPVKNANSFNASEHVAQRGRDGDDNGNPDAFKIYAEYHRNAREKFGVTEQQFRKAWERVMSHLLVDGAAGKISRSGIENMRIVIEGKGYKVGEIADISIQPTNLQIKSDTRNRTLTLPYGSVPELGIEE